jgi:hypothetical protein
MKAKKKSTSSQNHRLLDSNDPLGVRKTTLAGDTPSLHSALRFLERQKKAKLNSTPKEKNQNERKKTY